MNVFQHTCGQIEQAIRSDIGEKSDEQLRQLVSDWESLSVPRKMFYGLKPCGNENSPLNRAQVALWLLEEREAHSWACRG